MIYRYYQKLGVSEYMVWPRGAPSDPAKVLADSEVWTWDMVVEEMKHGVVMIPVTA